MRILRAGEAFEVPPGHDARVIGDEPFVTVEFGGVHGWAKPAEAGERFVATLLVTDIVDSTKWPFGWEMRPGKSCWPDTTRECGSSWTGSAAWRSTRRAMASLPSSTAQHEPCGARQRSAMVRCRMVSRSAQASIPAKSSATPEISGGIAVHAVTRIAALANPGEVLVSAPTASLLEGAGLQLEDAGEHELKGLAGARRIYRVAGSLPTSPQRTRHGQ